MVIWAAVLLCYQNQIFHSRVSIFEHTDCLQFSSLVYRAAMEIREKVAVSLGTASSGICSKAQFLGQRKKSLTGGCLWLICF